jgi:hypothetical protein
MGSETTENATQDNVFQPNERSRPFDLSEGLLLRVMLLQLNSSNTYSC